MPKDSFANIEDKELLNNYYNDHNNKWLGILLERYTMLLYGVCLKYLKDEEEAKDAVQQIYLKVITELQKYKVDFFKSWLYMIAKNLCLMKIRDRQGKVPVELNENFAQADTSISAGEQKEKEKILSFTEEGLMELSKEQQQCVILFYLRKKSYQQIADETGFSLLQVKSFIQNGKRNLKMIVEKKMKAVYG